MRVDDFDFDLPEELIALRPAKPRDASRLLHVGQAISDNQFTALPDLVSPGDVLVVNNTKVLPAALKGIRPARAVGGGGDVEVEFNLHKALPPGPDNKVRWRAFARPAKRLKEGDEVHFAGDLRAIATDRDAAEVTLEFQTSQTDFDAALKQAGSIPLPPYIGRKRAVDERDREDYQTIYAQEKGSVAAPTAGLHFTDEVFARLDKKGIKRAEVTLHVGAGTFLPVSVDDTKDHKMHAEWGQVSKETASLINKAKAGGHKVICVGTTSLRLLESAAAQKSVLQPFADETDIFITPGFEFKIADGLITNFHLPRSTLFMLVSAFAGMEKMKAAYAHAIAHNYRFYSYGDACYLERHDR
jgi:S-adenosylmethionine:tRNA ribosyltransferase-isomerase